MQSNQRYSRIDNLPLLANIPAYRFTKTKVAIAGVGNIGGYTAQHLAMMGFSLFLIDNGVVEKYNLGTQNFWDSQLGMQKVEARKAQLAIQNPTVSIGTLCEDISITGTGYFADCAAIFCCLDSWNTRSYLQQMARELGIPLIDSALDGSGLYLLGRISLFNYRNKNAACMFCSWDQERFNQVKEQETNSCPELLLGKPLHNSNPPTLSPGFFGAVISGIQVLEGIKILFNKNTRTAASYEILINLNTYDLHKYSLSLNKECLFAHGPDKLVYIGKNVAEFSIGELFNTAGKYLKAKNISLKPHRKRATVQLKCPSCGHIEDNLVLIESCPDHKRKCVKCTADLLPVPAKIVEKLTTAMFTDLNLPLSDFGFVDREIITGFSESKQISFVFN